MLTGWVEGTRVESRVERERGRCESERAVPTQWVQEVVVANTEATPSSDLQPLTFRLPLAVGSAAWRRPSCGWENTGGCVQVNGGRKLLRRDLILLLPVRAVCYYNKQVRGDTEFYFLYLLLHNKQLCGDTKFYFLYLLLYLNSFLVNPNSASSTFCYIINSSVATPSSASCICYHFIFF